MVGMMMRRIWVAGLALVLAIGFSGCDRGNGQAQFAADLYAVDTSSGKLFELDTVLGKVASTALAATGQNSSGEVEVFGGIAYVAVGSYNNDAPGLYRLDPENPGAGFSRIGTGISAQYICIVSATEGYVTSCDWSDVYPNALFSFDPSNPGAGLQQVATLSRPQDLARGADGMIYVAENGNAKVARIDPSAGTPLVAEIACSASGVTGLLAGSYGGQDGVFAASTGGYDAEWNPLPGSVDFVATSAGDGESATVVKAGLSAGRLAALSATLLVATSYGHTYVLDVSGTPAAVEVKHGTTAFGSTDIAVLDGTAYVPDGGNLVYAFGPDGVVDGSYSVGGSGESITNLGVLDQ